MSQQILTERQRLILDLHKHDRAFFMTHWADEGTADVVVEYNKEIPDVDMVVFFRSDGVAMLGAVIPHCLEAALCGMRREES